MKFCVKSFVVGVVVATIGVSTVFATGAIKSAEFNANKVVFDGKAIDMTASPMLSVVKEGEASFTNYMPLRAVLEAMGYDVGWDGATSTVSITTKGAAQVAPTPAPVEDISKKIVGFWTWVDEDGTAIKYYFDANGSFQVLAELHLTDGSIDSEIMKGKYTTTGNTVKMKYDDITLPEDGFDIKFAADGKSWSSYVEALDTTLEFKSDANAIWTKIIGYWIFTGTDGTIIKYHYAEDGHFDAYVELQLTDGTKESDTSKGIFITDGNKVMFKFDDVETAGDFEVKFAADGKSWTSYVEALDDTIEFKADTNTSWTK